MFDLSRYVKALRSRRRLQFALAIGWLGVAVTAMAIYSYVRSVPVRAVEVAAQPTLVKLTNLLQAMSVATSGTARPGVDVFIKGEPSLEYGADLLLTVELRTFAGAYVADVSMNGTDVAIAPGKSRVQVDPSASKTLHYVVTPKSHGLKSLVFVVEVDSQVARSLPITFVSQPRRTVLGISEEQQRDVNSILTLVGLGPLTLLGLNVLKERRQKASDRKKTQPME